MKKLIGTALIQTLSLTPEHMICKIDSHGQVSLHAEVQNLNETQRLIAYIGRENWDKPFEVRTSCEQIKNEINPQFVEKWVDYGCDGNWGVERTVFQFKLSEKGQALLKNHRSTLVFVPSEPINPSYLRYYENPSCDSL